MTLEDAGKEMRNFIQPVALQEDETQTVIDKKEEVTPTPAAPKPVAKKYKPAYKTPPRKRSDRG